MNTSPPLARREGRLVQLLQLRGDAGVLPHGAVPEKTGDGGFRVWDLGFRVSGHGVGGSGFRELGLRFSGQGFREFGLRTVGFGGIVWLEFKDIYTFRLK